MDSQTLARVRAQVSSLLNDTCTILRAMPTVDSSGYPAENFGTAVANAPCRLLPRNLRDNKGVVADKEQGRSYYTLVLAYDADLRDGDRVQVGTVTYEVVQIDTDRSDHTDKQAILARFG